MLGVMKARRFLLVTAALSTALATQGCGKEEKPKPVNPDEDIPLPANPKGSYYDSGLDEPPPPPPPPTRVPLPANPKGSHYDAGLHPPKPREK